MVSLLAQKLAKFHSIRMPIPKDNSKKWLKAILASNSPIVFSHCDFNRGNILIRENSNNNNPEIFLIDFDFSSYNYRGIDIGRYFSSWGHEDPMFGFGEYPTDEQMSVFVCAYINESIKLSGNSYSELEINSKENIIKEAKLFTLYSYLIDVIFCFYTSNNDESKSSEYLVSILVMMFIVRQIEGKCVQQ
jgi:thiamine kinase-like enzyme